jgi:hypothetical protein
MGSGGSGRACKANLDSTEQGVSQPTLTTLETVEQDRFEPWICVVYRPDKQRTLFGFAVGSALAETLGPVRAVGFAVELLAVQTCYFHQRPALVNWNDANWMQCVRNNASS